MGPDDPSPDKSPETEGAGQDTFAPESLMLGELSQPSGARITAAPPPSRPPAYFSVEDLAPGTEIGGRYVVQSKLGQGGMAAVYRVKHTQLDNDFAIKLVSVSSFRLRDRLMQEGRLQAW
jgi:serine/threonine protein kinase